MSLWTIQVADFPLNDSKMNQYDYVEEVANWLYN